LSPATFNLLTSVSHKFWKDAAYSATPSDIVKDLAAIGKPIVLGQHYYIANSTGTAILPKWDFTSASQSGHADAFVIGAKTGDIPAPFNPAVNVDWVSLKNATADGNLATQVFRVDTQGGQPPANVSNRSVIFTKAFMLTRMNGSALREHLELLLGLRLSIVSTSLRSLIDCYPLTLLFFVRVLWRIVLVTELTM
jgi:hypothetical protein